MAADSCPLATTVAAYREVGGDALTWDELAEVDVDPALARAAKTELGRQLPETYEIIPGRAQRYSRIVRVNHADGVAPERIVLFGVRVGVTAAQLARMLASVANPPPDALARAVRLRSDVFGLHVVRALYRNHSQVSLSLDTVVYLGTHATPHTCTDPRYLVAWAQAMTPRLEARTETASMRLSLPAHVHAIAAAPLERADEVCACLAQAFARDLVDREWLRDIALTHVISAPRPSDSWAWAHLLTDAVGVTADELAEQADMLLGGLTRTPGRVIEALGAPLIDVIDAQAFPQALVLVLSANTHRARQALCARLARRRVSDDLRLGCAGLIDEISRLDPRAGALVRRAWGYDAIAPAAPAVHEGLAWVSPRFRPVAPIEIRPRGDDDVCDRAVDLAAIRDPHACPTVESEIFLAALVAALATRTDDAFLSVLPLSWSTGVAAATAYRLGPGATPPAEYGYRIAHLRDIEVGRRLGDIPVALSQPTHTDLTLDPAQLVERLSLYRARGLAAGPYDVLLALLRLDRDRLDAPTRRRLVWSRVRVGNTRVGPVARAVLQWSGASPHLEYTRWGAHLAGTGELHELVNSLREALGIAVTRATVCPSDIPTWVAYGVSEYTPIEDVDTRAQRLRQAARSRDPWPPEVAWEVLCVLRDARPNRLDGLYRAVGEAFAAGRLRGEALAAGMRAHPQSVTKLAATARTLARLADLGMLSLAWPAWDGLAEVAAGASRCPAGTGEVLDALATYSPTVVEQIAQGGASGAATLAGVRRLAGTTSTLATRAGEILALFGEESS